MPTPATVLPDANVELVLTLAGPLELRLGKRFRPQPRGMVLGLATRPIEMRYRGWALTIGVRLHPALGGAFFGRTGASLVDGIESVAALSSALDRALRVWARTEAGGPAWRRTLESVLAAHLERTPPRRDEAIVAAVDALDVPEPPSVGHLATRLGLSPRQLGRRFTSVVGIPPARFVRVRRFSRAWNAALFSPPETWAGLAVEHGYADQAHMVRDFRAFGARPPSRLFPEGWHDSVMASPATEPDGG